MDDNTKAKVAELQRQVKEHVADLEMYEDEPKDSYWIIVLEDPSGLAPILYGPFETFEQADAVGQTINEDWITVQQVGEY